MEYDKKYTVYKHIFPNDKIYIGITCNSPKTRWGNQGYGYKNQLVGRAIKKYGWNNIEHIIIRKGLTKEEAKIAERKLIKKYMDIIVLLVVILNATVISYLKKRSKKEPIVSIANR